MDEHKKVTGIIVTHGNLGRELLRTASLIVGDIHDCYFIAGTGLTDDRIVEEIRKMLDRTGGGRVVMFVDYFGGSCCTNCVSAIRGRGKAKIISGVNLPIILDFVNKRESMDFDDMIEHLIERGRESVRAIDL
jgi:PTS system mannose-specific IIA component